MAQRDLFQSPIYEEIVYTFFDQTMIWFTLNSIEFSIACRIKYLDFDPPLPPEITEKFQPVMLFIISGYTFETLKVDDEARVITFEAGFGEENFGSVVRVPYLAIQELYVQDRLIFINHALPKPKLTKIDRSKLKIAPKPSKSSMEKLLNNPENQKLLKKKR